MSKGGRLSISALDGFGSASTPRPFGNLPPRRYFLIVCEGEKTEPNYFESIRRILPSEMVNRITIKGTGKNTLSLVEHAEAEVNKRKTTGMPPYYHIWVVFDRDSFDPDDFDNSIERIEAKSSVREKWHAAWSNEAFELWYIMHFRAQAGGPLSREAYQKILEYEMGRPYIKNAADMFELLKKHTSQAVKRAETALRLQSGALKYHEKNPATSVHLLVKELLRYIRKT